jgi:hypothetical protein
LAVGREAGLFEAEAMLGGESEAPVGEVVLAAGAVEHVVAFEGWGRGKAGAIGGFGEEAVEEVGMVLGAVEEGGGAGAAGGFEEVEGAGLGADDCVSRAGGELGGGPAVEGVIGLEPVLVGGGIKAVAEDFGEEGPGVFADAGGIEALDSAAAEFFGACDSREEAAPKTWGVIERAVEFVEEACFLGGQGELVGLMDARVGDRDHSENRKVP